MNINKLTKREKEVFDLMILGSSDKEIAEQLCLSLSTIKSHTDRIYRKLRFTGNCRMKLVVSVYRNTIKELTDELVALKEECEVDND